MDSNVPSSSKTKAKIISVDMQRLISTNSLPASTSVLEEKSKLKFEDTFKELEIWVKKLLSSPSETKCSSLYPVNIFKIPRKLYIENEDAFDPRLVSIGPYHHGKSNLQAMETYKVKCLCRFANRCPLPMNNIISELMDKEAEIRGCYEQNCDHLNNEQFVKMMMLDAIFIIEVALMESKADHKQKIFDDWMTSEILHDMLLLENQIPWFVLSLCLRHAQSEGTRENITEMQVKNMFDLLESLITYFKFMGIICPPRVILTQALNSNFVEMLGRSLLPEPNRREPKIQGNLKLRRTTTQLQDLGVRFIKADNSKALLDIEFHRRKLIIPQLTVNEWTETFFRNQIAFEQCGILRNDKVVTSYIMFMDSLIDTSEDVDLLVNCSIINNMLNDSQKVANLFNNLHKETLMDNKRFYYARLCEELNDYTRNYWFQWITKLNKWKRMFWSDSYFGNPWTTVSVIAACILLALTITQTYYSYVQTRGSKS